MSINKEKPHLYVLPEDDANRQIANGFLLNPMLNSYVIQVLPVAGGWRKVVELFEIDYCKKIQKYPEGRIVFLIDFDNKHEDRLSFIFTNIPEDIKTRVFVLGVLSEPEKLKAQSQLSYENIGKELANDCAESKEVYWSRDLLKHNQPELQRLFNSVKPFLFA